MTLIKRFSSLVVFSILLSCVREDTHLMSVQKSGEDIAIFGLVEGQQRIVSMTTEGKKFLVTVSDKSVTIKSSEEEKEVPVGVFFNHSGYEIIVNKK